MSLGEVWVPTKVSEEKYWIQSWNDQTFAQDLRTADLSKHLFRKSETTEGRCDCVQRVRVMEPTRLANEIQYFVTVQWQKKN